MATARIIINGVTSSYAEVTPGSIVTLKNDNTGGESSILWICPTGSQPSGTFDGFTTNNSTTTYLTASKEGSYLVYNLVNGALTSSAIIAVRGVKSYTRAPAAGERYEESGSFGWSRAIQGLYNAFDKLNADTGTVVGLAKTSLLRGDIVRATGTLNIKSGLPGQERLLEFAKVKDEQIYGSAYPYKDTLYIVEGEVASGSNSNPVSGTIITARLYGLFGPLTGSSPGLGKPVFIRRDGVPTLAVDYVDRKIGTVVSTNGSSYYINFNGAVSEPTNIRPVFNILDFGAVDDGVTDCATAIENAINAIPTKNKRWGLTSDRVNGAGTIFFPSTRATGSYVVSRKIVVPVDKNVTFIGDGIYSSRLLFTGAGGYMFECEGGSTSTKTFEKLTFHKGGIKLNGNLRNITIIRDNEFHQVPTWCIATSGVSVVGSIIENNSFFDNDGCINVEHSASDLWYIRNNRFIRAVSSSVIIKTTGIWLTDNQFEQKASASAQFDQPFLQVSAQGLCQIVGNRFGGESGSTGRAPRDFIVFGEPGVTSSAGMETFFVARNFFFGPEGGTGNSQIGYHAIRLNQPIHNSVFDSNHFRDFEGPIVGEYYDNSGSVCYNNKWLNNNAYNYTGSIFSKYGAGFRRDDLPPQSQHRNTRNFLRLTEDIHNSATWIKTKVAVSKSAVGPDGVAGSAYYLDRIDAGTAFVRIPTQSSVATESGPVTFSVWMKKTGSAAPVNIGRVGLLVNNIELENLVRDDRVLTDNWELYTTTSNINAGDIITAGIYNGESGDTLTTGSIAFYAPQLEYGRTRTAYLPNSSSTVHADRQPNALQLGPSVVGYGTAIPTSGRYEVGDIVVKTVTETTGTMGWVCTTAGSPGTWKQWGLIDQPRIGSSSQRFESEINCGDNESYSGSIPFAVKQVVLDPPRYVLANCTTSVEFYAIVTNSTVNSFTSSVKLTNVSDSDDITTLAFFGSNTLQVKSASLTIGASAGQIDNSEKVYEISISASSGIGTMDFGSAGLRIIRTIG